MQADGSQDARVLATMERAALDAARFIRERAATRRAIEWRDKGPADFVSDVDTGAERLIRERLLADVPGAVVLGEELSPHAAPASGTTFIVDPLDGTTNFLHGYPAYAVSIGALADSVLAAGVIVHVPAGDVYVARRGAGAFRNGERIRVSDIREPGRALVGTGFPFKNLDVLARYERQFALVTRATAGIRRAGSAALDLADVASGRFDAFWELTLAPWDFAAGTLLIREAGGVVTDVDGEELPLARSSSVLAGNPTLHAWLRDALHDASVDAAVPFISPPRS